MPDKLAPRLGLAAAFLALAVLKLWLAGAQDLQAVGNAFHDDRLFVDQAAHLMEGEWLGPYHERTLIKGPFFPLWIAAAHLAGVPLLLAGQLLYLAACWLLARSLAPLLGGPLGELLLFAVLLFNPMSFVDGPMTRVMREGIYPALTLLVVAGALGLLLRADRPPRRLLAWSIGLGLALGALWLTREEGIWLLPSVLLVVGAAAWRMLRLADRDRPRRLVLAALPFALAAAAVSAVALTNRAHYGEAVVTEVKAKPFRSAYGALLRAGAASYRPRVPVPAEVRRRLYEVSPAFAELESYFEGTPGRRWLTSSCHHSGICDDLSGAYFIWVLRQAANAAGHHESLQSADAYYRRLAAEIDAACASGALPCTAPRETLRPVLRREEAGEIAGALLEGARFLARFGHFVVGERLSQGPPASLDLFRTVTRERLLPTERPMAHLEGWALAPGGAPGREIELVLRRPDGSPAPARVRFRSSPGAYRYFLDRGRDLPEARRARFSVWTDCTVCFLEVRAGGRPLASVPADGRERRIDRPDLFFHLWPDEELAGRAAAGPGAAGLKLRVIYRLGSLYQAVIPILAPLALIAFVAATAWGLARKRLSPAWIAAAALLGAVAARLVLLSLIDVTTYPAIRGSYLTPAHPLLLTLVVLLAIRGLSGLRRRRPPLAR